MVAEQVEGYLCVGYQADELRGSRGAGRENRRRARLLERYAGQQRHLPPSQGRRIGSYSSALGYWQGEKDLCPGKDRIVVVEQAEVGVEGAAG